MRVRSDRPDERVVLFKGSGAVDIRARSGRFRVDLSGLFAGLPQRVGVPLRKPIDLRWDAKTLYGASQGSEVRLPRDPARRSGGLIGRLPDEPQALLRLLERGTAAKFDQDDGDTVVFALATASASAVGVPAEFGRGDASPTIGPRLELGVTVDGEGRPAVISYTYRQQPTRPGAGGGVLLPARRVTVSYKLAHLGDDVRIER